MAAKVSVIVAHIETLRLDAVVNAANRHLWPGSGVDGALRSAAGPELTRMTQNLSPIADGEAVITPGFRAPMRHIIHTAAPIWDAPGDENEKIAVLGRCYSNSIALAHTHALASLAFPCLGTGIYGWPRELACGIALTASATALTDAPGISELVFCCFSESDAEIYHARMK